MKLLILLVSSFLLLAPSSIAPADPNDPSASSQQFESAKQSCLAVKDEEPPGVHYDADEHPEYAPTDAHLVWNHNWYGVLIHNNSDVTITRILCGSMSVGYFNDANLLRGLSIPPGGVQYVHYYDPSHDCKNVFVAQGLLGERTLESITIMDSRCGYNDWTINMMPLKESTPYV